MNKTLGEMKTLLKKLLHRHKYTELYMYPPKLKYYKNNWGFLVGCICGHTKIASLPRSIDIVHEVRSTVNVTARPKLRVVK